ncbi:MAG: phospho-N-acetylmuramoyl-pentapeptide-transferase [Bacteroidetes bacterium]|nr:phospho-N-acetylmuramoyl-pentapeptide-transferase [Bacteroidota bacterium]
MLYWLAMWINETFNPPGFDVFRFITFRAGLAAITGLVVGLWLGPKFIAYLRKLQIGEEITKDGPQSHFSKAGTPTMGGLIVLTSILAGTVLWSDLTNVYVWLIILTLVWMGTVGFIDDYLKCIKKYPKGLVARYKIMGQVGLGLIVGLVLSLDPTFSKSLTLTTIPFFKDATLDYGWLYIPVVIFIITAVSNAVNLTDGLDGLAIGVTAIVMIPIAIMCYVSGNVKFADYLDIIYLAGSGELTIASLAIIGASLGFLWYNSNPAQVFMGDTGSLALGGALGVIAIVIKKELFLPILAGVFFMETISVILQRLYFKYTKKKYGEGRRIFRMAPIHHHFELLGWPETKIVTRFWIVAIILSLTTLALLKLR